MLTALGAILPFLVFGAMLLLAALVWPLLRKPAEAEAEPKAEVEVEAALNAEQRIEQAAAADELVLSQPALKPTEKKFGALVENLAAPKEVDEREKLRIWLVQAEYRGRQAVATFLAVRVGLALALPVILAVVLRPGGLFKIFFVLILGANLGYYIPWMIVEARRNARQAKILAAFPNALDMLVSCLEAGLGLDAAFMRVSRELAHTAPELAYELEIVTQESSAGIPRLDALRRLADRTGVGEISSLVNVLSHAEKFGSGVADSLRAHAQLVRKRRALDAEKRAAQAAPKLTVVMVLFILPALFAVVLGPAVVNVVQILLPTMSQRE